MADPNLVVTSYFLRRRLIAALVLLVSVVVFCGAGAIIAGATYRKNLATVHHFYVVAHKAASIGVIAREQYMHEAHTIIVGDRSHLAHHDAWVAEFEREISAFPPDLEKEQSGLLQSIRSESAALTHTFAAEIVPAVTTTARDTTAVRDAHKRAIDLVESITEHSDALEQYFDGRAHEAELAANRAASIMFPVSIASCGVAALFALLVARRLSQSFQVPLATLKVVAERISAGDHEARVGHIQAEELAVLGHAFNAMLDALAKQRAQLLVTERLATLGRVAAGVAHEINNPIAVIRGYLKTMQKEAVTTSLRDELGILDEEAAACQRIAEDLLAYTRAPALFLEDVDIVSLVEESIARCQSESGKLDMPVRVDVMPARLRLDPIRMKQVLVNLLRNASQAAAGGGTIEIQGRGGLPFYRLSVLDRGPGIPADVRDRLFEPFFTTRRDGVGLGLAVCYGLVNAHGGTISAGDRTGGGLEVIVELPVEVTAAP